MAQIGAEFNAGFSGFGRALSDLTKTIRASISSIEKFSASLGVSTTAVNRFTAALNRATSALGSSASRSRVNSGSGGFYPPALRGAAAQFNIGGSNGGGGLFGVFKGISDKIAGFTAMLKPIGIIAAAVTVVFMALRKAGEMLSRTFEWIATTARNFAETYATSRRIGAKVSETEVLQRAFEGSGASRSSMNIAIQSMLRQIGRNNPIFSELGMNTSALNSMGGLKAFKEVINALGKIKNTSKLEAAITTIFGRGSQNFPVELIRDPKILQSADVSTSKEYKQYMDAAGKTWADIALYTQFFKSKWQEFSMGFLSVFDTELKDLTNAMSQKDLFTMGKEIAETLKPMIMLIAQTIGALLSFFMLLAKVIGAVIRAFEALFKVLEVIVRGWKYIFDGISSAIDKIAAWAGKITDEDRQEKKAFDEEIAQEEKKTLESGRPDWVKTIELSCLELSKKTNYWLKGWDKIEKEDQLKAQEERQQREQFGAGGVEDISAPKPEEGGGSYGRMENVRGGWGSVGGYMNAAQSSLMNNTTIYSNIVKQTVLLNQLVTCANEMLGVFRVQLPNVEAPSYVY